MAETVSTMGVKYGHGYLRVMGNSRFMSPSTDREVRLSRPRGGEMTSNPKIQMLLSDSGPTGIPFPLEISPDA